MFATVGVTAQNYSPSPDLEALHVPFDALLDAARARWARVLQGAAGRSRPAEPLHRIARTRPSVVSGYAKWSDDQKKAFWLNAYNALVMQTVINHYPIRGTAKNYPANSIRQIPGAFEKTAHAIAGKQLTLDQIETTVLAELQRSARLPRARARGGRQRTPAQRGIQREGGRQAARRRPRRSSR